MKVILEAPYGVKKEHVDGVFLGYFAVAKKSELPKEPKAYLKILDNLILWLPDEPNRKLLLADPIKFGQGIPKPQANNTVPLAARLKARFNWADSLCVVAEKLMVANNLDDLEALAGRHLELRRGEVAMLIAYYDPEGLKKILATPFGKKPMPLSYYLREIEALAGPLNSFTCDPASVSNAITSALEKAAKS